jgi:hypothetical protein
VTALLFTVGKYLLGLYLGRESMASAYGAAGSVVVLLMWVYYASLILLAGAEFTQVYAKTVGAGIRPSEHAERVDEEERNKQGIPHSGSKERAGDGLQPAFSRGTQTDSRIPARPVTVGSGSPMVKLACVSAGFVMMKSVLGWWLGKPRRRPHE